MIAEVGPALAMVGEGLADLAGLAGVRTVRVEAHWEFFEFPVSVVEVSVHVAGDSRDVEALAGWLGLTVESDEVRAGLVLPDGTATTARRWVTWSGWGPDVSLDHPVLWQVTAAFDTDRQAVA